MATVDRQLDSGLTQVPLEVLLRITYFISTTDLANVRLTCKALEQGLFSFFSHEFFRKKQFMALTDSLQALVDISKHPTLSPCLKHVIISTDRPRPDRYVPDRNSEPRARHELAVADHMQLLATGGLRDMLAEAFANLPNLETVDIRDFNSRTRNRDGLGTQWRSYGAGTLAASTEGGAMSGPFRDHDPYTTQLFSAVTAALASAQAMPKSLEVLIRTRGWQSFALHDTAFYIPPRMESSMSSLLAGLKSLHLCLSLTEPSNTRMRPFMYQRFLSLGTNLTWLRLNFSGTSKQHIEDVLSWLALRDTETPEASFDMHPIELPYLERLDLGSAQTEPQKLLHLVAKFAPTLTSLYLRRVSLYISTDQLSRKANPWVGWSTALAKLPGLNLRVLDFSDITISNLGSTRPPFMDVTFRQSEASAASKNWTCSTKLVTLDKALDLAAAAMAIDWPRTPSPEPMDEDDSEDDEDDEDADEDDAGF